MATKFEKITALYDETLSGVPQSAESWAAFLHTAAHNYKYSFHDQISIHSQRPDATACASLDFWNKRLDRWINRGARGIALINTDRREARLSYVFDISDTHGRTVNLWEAKPEYASGIVESLQNSYGESDASDFVGAVKAAVTSAVADNFVDYYNELVLSDLFGEYDPDDFKAILAESISYMVLTRCGINAEQHTDNNILGRITQYSYPDALAQLGSAVSDISETILRDIEATVRNIQKSENQPRHTFAKIIDWVQNVTADRTNHIRADERSEDSNGDHLHTGQERDTLPESEPAGGADRAGRLRDEAQAVPQGASPRSILGADPERQAEQPSRSGRADGPRNDGEADERNGTGGGRDGAAQGNRPDALGTADEQHPQQSGGDSQPRSDIQLTDSGNAGGEKLPAFLDEKLISAIISNRDDDLKIKKADIAAYFEAHPDIEDRERYLKSAYQDRFTEIIVDGERVGYKPQENGLLMWEGAYLSRKSESVFSWRLTAELVGRLVENHEYDFTPLRANENVQMSLLGMPEIQPENAPQRREPSPQLRISQQVIDEALCLGGNRRGSTLNIAAKFKKQLTPEENAAFLKREYRYGGHGFMFEGQPVSMWWDENGIRIAVGNTAIESKSAVIVTWEQAAKRIGELLQNGRYLPGEDLLRVDEHEITELAGMMWNIWRDDAGGIPERWDSHKGYPDDRKLIEADLRDRDKLPEIISELEAALAKAENEPNRRRWHDTRQFIRDLKDLMREPAVYTAAEMTAAEREKFITQDEIDAVIAGYMPVSDGKLRVYEFFEREKGKNERIAAVRNEYGIGGSSNAIAGADDSWRSYDGKGLLLTRGIITAPYAKVLLPWAKVVDRIEYLIRNDRFLTPAEKEKYPAYKAQLEERRQQREEAEIIAAKEREAAESSVRVYDLSLGTEVYIGTKKYAIHSITDAMVQLRPDDAPLFIEDLPRGVFDRRLRENPLNDHLIINTLDKKTEQTEPTEQQETNNDLVGAELEIDGRRFSVESVNAGTAELRDITFQNDTGFPIFRNEPVSRVRKLLASPDGEKSSDDTDPKLRSIVIELNPSADFSRESEFSDEPDLIPQWEEHRTAEAEPEITGERHNYRITDDNLGIGGAKAKYSANVAAIRLLKTIESEHRLATPEEQEVLSRYVGWGGIPQAFDESNPQWANEYQELKGLLTPEEYEAARSSTLNAFYTSPVVMKAMYEALGNMGFESGNILEPSCGVGNFFGLLPEKMSKSKMFGVELDSITGRIAKQLYQQSDIRVQGFERSEFPDSFFDVAIGNVPFGDYKLSDRRYDRNNFLIHDYFFAKALDKVRPGGIIAFVTSSGTLDKKNSAVRKYIAQRADLIGAIRLPNNAFRANAGTDVTADIIFLQKRDRIVEAEPDWVHLDTDKNGITMNSYFVENPDMILGEMTTENTMYGRQDAVCKPIDGADLAEQLHDAIANINAQITEYEIEDSGEEMQDDSIPADPSVRNFSYTIVDGRIYFRENSRMTPVELSVTAQNRVKGMIKLRDCVRKLIELQTEDYPDVEIEKQQRELNRQYDEFAQKYGRINSRGNSAAFGSDSSYCLLCSLEVLDDDGEFKEKAAIFSKRTIRPRIEVTSVDTASEALALSLNERAFVDLPYMAQLTGKTEKEIVADLNGVIFRVPNTVDDSGKPVYVAADEYLSGNVRQKLREARQASESDPSFAVNVAALEAVQPKDLTASEVSVRLGATWIPPEIVQQFMFELLHTPRYYQYRMTVHYSPATAQWFVENKSTDRGNFQATSTYGTQRMNAYSIIEDTLNLREVKIFDTVENPDGSTSRVLNKRETAIAQGKQEMIRQKFTEWIWADPSRREKLLRMYNERFNSTRPREYDGSHLTFPGMNPEITLKPHQVNAVAHVLYGGNTLLAHAVGAGKTYEMAAAAMESKRLGLCHKPLFVVPNHLTEQWAAEFLQLYPSANILVATKKDFEPRNRKKFCARIATGDYDAIIIGHSQFEKIPISLERQERFIQDQIEELVDGIADVKSQHGERFTIKQLERAKKQLETRLKKLHDQSKKDDVVTFEELGVDRIFVDEAHSFKNLAAVTKMTRVAGISQTEAMKSSDLYAKCRYLDEITGGKGVIFATGTPISNSMVELYTMQRYLQYDTLRRNGLSHFDCWASTFGECVTAIELAPEGTGYRAKTRFSKFYNLPELMAMFKEVADVKTSDMLPLKVPNAHFHTIAVKPSEHQQAMVESLSERADRVRNGMVDPSVDNMLKITNDGRKLALDQRMIDPMLPDNPDSKTNACVRNVYEIWQRTTPNRSAQLIFCDLSTPKADGSFNVYDDIRSKLIAMGVPPEEIAYIHTADTEAKKKEMFGKVRSGQIRVLIGSTAKMGAGTNVQKRLAALHHLDCPWRPADIEQREGRLIRQGNDNSDVDVFSYVTEGTFDAYLYQLVENKQKFIGQIMTSKSPARSAEDVDEQALSYAEIKALAAGDPSINEKMDLDVAVTKLQLLKASYLSQRYALEDRILGEFPRTIAQKEQRIAGLEADIATAAAHPIDKDHFPPMTVQGIIYGEKAAAGEALIKACKAMTSPEPIRVGNYRGFDLELSFDSFSKVYVLTLVGQLRYNVELGTDPIGNITRTENVIDGFRKNLEACREQLATVQSQLEAAKIEVQKPFAQEDELTQKLARLAELNAHLNLDEKESVLLDGEPDEGEDKAVPEKSSGAR